MTRRSDVLGKSCWITPSSPECRGSECEWNSEDISQVPWVDGVASRTRTKITANMKIFFITDFLPSGHSSVSTSVLVQDTTRPSLPGLPTAPSAFHL